jgi:hypothetical protein
MGPAGPVTGFPFKLTFTFSRKVIAPGLASIKHVILNQAAAGCVSLFRLDVAVTFVIYCHLVAF